MSKLKNIYTLVKVLQTISEIQTFTDDSKADHLYDRLCVLLSEIDYKALEDKFKLQVIEIANYLKKESKNRKANNALTKLSKFNNGDKNNLY